MKKLLCLVLAVMTLSVFAGCSQGEAEITAYEPANPVSAVKTCGEASWTVSYVYDENSQLIKEIITDAEGNAINNYYIFQKDGTCASEVHNNPDGTKDKYRHSYTDGVRTKTVHTEPSGAKNTYVFTYNEDGTIAGYTLTLASKEVQEAAYTYNPLGGLAQIDRTGANPSVTAYEYDKHGQVIKETFTADGVETVTTYEYTY